MRESRDIPEQLSVLLKLPTNEEFRLLRDLIHRETGIHLSDGKKPLLAGRLTRRLRDLGIESFGAYYRRARTDADELTWMLDAVSTNETHFFREPKHFEFLNQVLFPLWRREMDAGRRDAGIRIWSAACSSGEEPFSVAMSLLAYFGDGVRAEILASDVSTRMLARASEAEWPIAKSSEIPSDLLRRFMLKGSGSRAGMMKAGPEMRALVRVKRINLNDQNYRITGSFDLILCRNVLIYFDAPTKSRVVDRIADFLGRDGVFLVGHAETIVGMTQSLRVIQPNICVRKESAVWNDLTAARKHTPS